MRKCLLLAVIAGFLCSLPVKATSTVLGFDNLKCLEGVGQYYNGGSGSMGTGPGPSDGIVFSQNAITLQDFFTNPTTCGSNTGNMPSAPMGLFFLSGNAATMDVLGGFTTGFSFDYTAQNVPGVVNVWSGLDSTGTLLATLTLPTNDSTCLVTPTFCHWDPVGVAFPGTAHSVDFGGSVNQIVFDDITIGSQTVGGGGGTPAPEPSTLLLLGAGLVGMIASRRRASSVLALD